MVGGRVRALDRRSHLPRHRGLSLVEPCSLLHSEFSPTCPTPVQGPSLSPFGWPHHLLFQGPAQKPPRLPSWHCDCEWPCLPLSGLTGTELAQGLTQYRVLEGGAERGQRGAWGGQEGPGMGTGLWS